MKRKKELDEEFVPEEKLIGSDDDEEFEDNLEEDMLEDIDTQNIESSQDIIKRKENTTIFKKNPENRYDEYDFGLENERANFSTMRVDPGKKPLSLSAPRDPTNVKFESYDKITLYQRFVPKKNYTSYGDSSNKKDLFDQARYVEKRFIQYGLINRESKITNAETFYQAHSSNSEYGNRKKQAIAELEKKIKELKIKGNTSEIEKEIEEHQKTINKLNSTRVEWLHTIADSLGGPLDYWNVAAGSYASNTQMATIENAIRKKPGVSVEVTAYTSPGQRIAEWYTYKVIMETSAGKPEEIVFEIDARREWYNKEDFEKDFKKINDALLRTEKSRNEFEKNFPRKDNSVQMPLVKEIHLQDKKQEGRYPQEGRIPVFRMIERAQKRTNILVNTKNTQDGFSPTKDNMPDENIFDFEKYQQQRRIDRACYFTLTNQSEKLKDLLKKDPTLVNARDRDGKPLLAIALEKDYKDLAKELLQIKDIDQTIKNCYGKEPWDFASPQTDPELMNPTKKLKQEKQQNFSAAKAITQYSSIIKPGTESPPKPKPKSKPTINIPEDQSPKRGL